GRPQVQHENGRPLDLKLRGVGYRVSVARIGHKRFHIGISGGGGVHPADVEIERFDSHSGQITVNGQRYRLVTSTHGPIHLVEVDGVTHRVSRDEGGVVRSPAPALVVAAPVSVGDEVDANAPILVLESMKMETVLRSPFRARVRELPVSVGSQVETGTALLRLEPLAGEGVEAEATGTGGAAEIELPAEPAPASAASRAERGLQDLRSLLLGFDVDPHDQRRTLAGYLAARAELGETGRPLTAEVELLQIFADLSELTRNKPAGEDLSAEGTVHSAREYFHTYLQSLDVERAGLPETFQGRLRRVLGHYGVAGLERTPELEEAVFRIFLAQQRASADVAIVSALLRQWLTEAPPAGSPREEAGLALEHLVSATQVRYPSVSDLARGVVFRWFAQPLLRRARAEAYARVRQNLRHLDRNPDSPDRAERIAAMVAVAEPLVRLLGQRIGRPGTDPAPLLEVLTRRYYGNKGLSDVRSRDVAGCTFVTAEHVEPARVVTTAVDFAQLADAVRAVGELATDIPASAHVVADVYLRWAGQPDVDAMAARLGEVITAEPLPERVDRITTTVAG
ncbi:MAG: acetyl-CoA carboxylase biotin carboxyl carrier protein subunit, partial [Solirubrobacteraceae bacterium]